MKYLFLASAMLFFVLASARTDGVLASKGNQDIVAALCGIGLACLSVGESISSARREEKK